MASSPLACALLLLACPLVSAIKRPQQVSPTSPKTPWVGGVLIVQPEDRRQRQTMAYDDGMLIAPNRVPFLDELREVRLSEGGNISSEKRTLEQSTVVYLGMGGRCQVELELHQNATARGNGHTVTVLPGDTRKVPMWRGKAVHVFPGVQHRVSLLEPDDREAFGPKASSCLVLRLQVASGSYDWPKMHGYVDRDYTELARERAHHVKGKFATMSKDLPDAYAVSKRVFFTSNDIPGLYQFSISELEAGFGSLPHSHPTATEVFLNYGGVGCKLKTSAKGFEQWFDMNNGKMAAVQARVDITSYNTDDRRGCQNVNMIIGDPQKN